MDDGIVSISEKAFHGCKNICYLIVLGTVEMTYKEALKDTADRIVVVNCFDTPPQGHYRTEQARHYLPR